MNEEEEADGWKFICVIKLYDKRAERTDRLSFPTVIMSAAAAPPLPPSADAGVVCV